MKLGMQVGLGPGHIVLGADPAPPPLKGQTPIFGPYLLRPNGCMDQDVTWYGGRPRPKQLYVRWGPRSPSTKGGQSPPSQIFGPCLLRPNGWMDEAGTWQGGRPQPRRLCVRWGPSQLPPKGGEPPPQFSAHFYCGQTAACIKIPLGMELGLGPGDFVLDGDPASPSPKGHSAQFSAHICCSQMAAWIKMSLGMELGLGSGGWGPSCPLPKFSAHVYCDQTAGWMKLVLGMMVGLSPGEFVLDGDQSKYNRPVQGRDLHTGATVHLWRATVHP